jgi:hypothetical protein
LYWGHVVALKIIFALLGVGWLVLFLSGYGMLLKSDQKRALGERQDHLVCSYFTATSMIEKTYWYSSNGTFGRASCPRLIRI